MRNLYTPYLRGDDSTQRARAYGKIKAGLFSAPCETTRLRVSLRRGKSVTAKGHYKYSLLFLDTHVVWFPKRVEYWLSNDVRAHT